MTSDNDGSQQRLLGKNDWASLLQKLSKQNIVMKFADLCDENWFDNVAGAAKTSASAARSTAQKLANKSKGKPTQYKVLTMTAHL